MSLISMVNHLQKSTLTAELILRAKRSEKLILTGSPRPGKALLASSIAREECKSIFIVVPTLEEAARWYSLLEVMGWDKTYLYPSSENSPYEQFDSTSEIIWGQLQVLSELMSDNSNISTAIVATERSLQPHLPPKQYLSQRCLSIRKGNIFDLNILSKKIAKLGYQKVEVIEQEGTWSRRGDIIDIYPVSSELPIRLEFFGDEIDKLREFDPITQRSLDTIDEIFLTPTSFGPIISNELRNNTPDNLEHYLDDRSIEKIVDGQDPEGLNRLMGLVWSEPSSLIDYISKDTCVVIDEKSQSYAHGIQWLEHVNESYNELTSHNANNYNKKLPASMHKDIKESFLQLDDFFGFECTELSDSKNQDNSFDISHRSITSIANQFGKLAENIKSYQKDKYAIWVISAQPSRAVALLQEHDCAINFIPNANNQIAIQRLIEQQTPIALKNRFNSDIEGFVLPAWNIILLTDKEIFGQHNLGSLGYIRRRRASSSRSVNPNKMKPGDYVVHRNHGIGKFIKIEKNLISGESRDYLVVEYLDGKLSVAADQLGSLARYRSSDDKKPIINKMGGLSWTKQKEKAKKQLKKVAIDLVRLYAERIKVQGYAFPDDGPWQRELEDSFPYEPTADQIKAVREVKIDMQKNTPMDRLVCGDVGFGKTEVAVRAMFKAITAGKQVALLAPTTVLAQQHWRTISERFAPYPIKVSLLNRFRTTLERKNIITELRLGKIDAVIGTHQLLSKQIEFNKLGLLVIDEEQRFGVNQKEKIKTVKKNLDVLTLSATPIPRTLYMSLSGVREMSLITTPPPLRRPIKTHLSSLDEEVIRSAISQELERGGQIFYVVPRVDGIEDVANKIRTMIPNIKLIIAHGQMNEGELENSMVAFNAGEADLMLCTTIIESGLDIPRVNTILIEDGHKFGLSQLYQLRGRVGRSGVQAHAWIFYPSDTALNDSARQRLRAIQEFAQLGSGYQLAMRDMEIRGVGNILGAEQSGQMESIGFDLYMELLQECLADLQGQDIPIVEEAQIELQITAFIPSDWINDNNEKISAYRSATECDSIDKLIDLAATWADRYGAIPGPVEALVEIMKLKLLAKKCGFSRIKKEKNNIILETSMQEPAFRVLRQGLHQHLHQRLIYKQLDGKKAAVVARGIGALSVDKQIESLVDWFNQMSDKIADQEGLTKSEKDKILNEKNNQVIKL